MVQKMFDLGIICYQHICPKDLKHPKTITPKSQTPFESIGIHYFMFLRMCLNEGAFY
jgi:hypothetical protein